MISQWPRIKQRLCNYRFRTYFSRSSCGWMGMLKLIIVVNKQAVPPNRSIVSYFGWPPIECTLRLIDLIITFFVRWWYSTYASETICAHCTVVIDLAQAKTHLAGFSLSLSLVPEQHIARASTMSHCAHIRLFRVLHCMCGMRVCAAEFNCSPNCPVVVGQSRIVYTRFLCFSNFYSCFLFFQNLTFSAAATHPLTNYIHSSTLHVHNECCVHLSSSSYAICISSVRTRAESIPLAL